MRFAYLCVALLVLGACRAPYLADYANLATQPEDLPSTGTTDTELALWFVERGYRPGPRVRQSEAELRRLPGDPLTYSLEIDRRWWRTQHRTTRHVCVTKRTIYYALTPEGDLEQAIQGWTSQC